MTLPTFADHMRVNRLSPGRALWAIARASERFAQLTADLPDGLDAAKLAPLGAAFDQAHTAHKARLSAHDAWAKRDTTDAAQRVRDLRAQLRTADQRVDRCVGALDSACANAAAIFEDHPAKAAAALRLRSALLPRGVGAITQLSYIEQHAQVGLMLEAAAARSADVALLHLDDHIAVTEHAHATMGALLDQLERNNASVTWSDVRAADLAAHEALCALIAHTLTALVPAHSALAERLLEPIYAQQTAMRDARRTNAPDINPATGDPLDPSA